MLFLTSMAGALSTSILLASNHKEILYNIGMTNDTKITTLTALSNLQREYSNNLTNAQNKLNSAKLMKPTKMNGRLTMSLATSNHSKPMSSQA